MTTDVDIVHSTLKAYEALYGNEHERHQASDAFERIEKHLMDTTNLSVEWMKKHDKLLQTIHRLERRELAILGERDEETARLAETADELAFWKHQAIYYCAYFIAAHRGDAPTSDDMEKAEEVLNDNRISENTAGDNNMKYHYEIGSGGRLQIEITGYPLDHDTLAERCAEDYHNNHGGWEASWPLELVIYGYSNKEDGKELWRGRVDREARPHFLARTDGA